MSTTLSIATMNSENLFSRPVVFTATNKKSKEVLGSFDELKKELRRKTFDQAKIKKLKENIQGYAKVVDVRGKHTSATGIEDWLGWAELIRKPADEDAVKHLAMVIAEANADIVCMIEVEDRILLQQFHDKYLKTAHKIEYEYIRLIDGNDTRGLDVAVMSRLPGYLVLR